MSPTTLLTTPYVHALCFKTLIMCHNVKGLVASTLISLQVIYRMWKTLFIYGHT